MGNWNPWALLIRTGNGTVTVEIDMVVPQNIKLELLYDMANPLVFYIYKITERTHVDICPPMFTTALFTITKR